MSLVQEKVIQEVGGREAKSFSVTARATSVAKPPSLKPLRVGLQLAGLTFLFGLYALTVVWPSGWVWHTGHTSHYLQMILGGYATLGVFLLIASRDPLANLSLIWFTVWSSVVHAGIMAVQALINPEHRGHLAGDVPALLVVAAVLAILTRRTTAATAFSEAK